MGPRVGTADPLRPPNIVFRRIRLKYITMEELSLLSLKKSTANLGKLVLLTKFNEPKEKLKNAIEKEV